MIPVRDAKLPTAGILSYLYPRTDKHHHRGVDLVAPRNTPVLAAAAGKVTHAFDRWRSGFSGYGRIVAIEHMDGRHTLYAHLQQVLAHPGQIVQEGEAIGTVGNSRFSRENPTLEQGGYHLHFEVATAPYPNIEPEDPAARDNRIDPIAWLRSLPSAIAEGPRVAALPFSSPQRPASLACPHCGGSVVLARAEQGVG